MWITGFLYGVLRPLDGIVPYRMEQGITLDATDGMPVNRFWRATGGATQIVLDSVAADNGVLVHLSTTEFESIFDMKRLSSEARLVQPMFYVSTGGRLAVQAVWAKACRGAMLRYIIDNRIYNPTLLAGFDYEGFHFAPGAGDDLHPCFIKEK